MKINISTNISKKFEEIQVIINTPEDNENLRKLKDIIIQISKERKQIVGINDNQNYIIDTDKIIYFYSETKYNYCKTYDGVFRIKEKLYELENELEKSYVRISNSCIINLKFVKMFDTNFTGTIEVVFKDESKEYVSRRRVKEVLKKIREWGN